MDPIREKLIMLDEQAEHFKQQNKYLESLQAFEEMLMIIKSAYGDDSKEYFKTADKLCELCNFLSMIFLQKDKFDASFEFLKKAEQLAQSSSHYRAMTYKNFAIYYKKCGKLGAALNYLQQALDLEIKSDSTQSLADTHLNMCAVLSQLKKHKDALQHILMSVALLQNDLLLNPANITDINEDTQKSNSSYCRVQVLSIAFQNLAVQLEFLKRYDEAIQTYQKAYRFASRHLPPQDKLVENLKNILDNAQELKIQKQTEQDRKRDREQTSKASAIRKINKVSNLYSDKPATRMGTTGMSNNQGQGFAPRQTQQFENNQRHQQDVNEEDDESSLNDQHEELHNEAQQQLQQRENQEELI